MTAAVWEFDVPLENTFTLQMPSAAQPLTLQLEGEDDMKLWAMVDTLAPLVPRTFALFGTGQPLDAHQWQWRYIGTVQLRLIVVHLFETTEEEPI